MLDDAWQSMLPHPLIQIASRWHGLDAASLRAEAQKQGYFSGKHKKLRELQEKRTAAEGMRKTADDYTGEEFIDWDGDLPKNIPTEKRHLIEFLEKYVEDPLANVPEASTLDPGLSAAVTRLARHLEADISEFQTRQDAALDRFRTSHNRRMVGPTRAMGNLRHTIETEGRYPTETSGAAYLCGVNAIVMSLNDLVRYSTLAQRRLWFGTENPARFTADELMRLLLTNYDPTVDPSEVPQGEPTEDYEGYIQDVDLVGRLGSEQGAWEHQRMLSVNNLRLVQLQAIMRLLWYKERIRAGFGLGVKTGAHFNDYDDFEPATAVLHRDPDEDRPTVWLHNEQLIEQTLYGEQLDHWEGFTHAGHANALIAWGMPQATGGIVPPKLRWSQYDPSEIPREEKSQEDLRKEGEARKNTLKIKKLRNSCLDCATVFDESCDGVPGHRDCSRCLRQEKECAWPATRTKRSTWRFRIRLEERQFSEIPTSWTNPPRPEKPHFAVLLFLRVSSHGGLAAFNQQCANAQATAAFYDQIFDAPNPTALVGFDATRAPDGSRLPAHIRIYPFARHGTRKVPVSHDNLDNPVLDDFIDYLNVITDPATPAAQRPQEIQIVTMGIPGLAVDITAFGDTVGGFVGRLCAADRQLGTNYFKKTFVIPLVEAKVVDALTPTSLPGAGQFDPLDSNAALRANGLQPPRWGFWRQKYLQKLSLRRLVLRAQMVRGARHNNFVNNQANAVPPVYSNQPGWAGEDEKLDRYIDAAFEEMAWRSAWLSTQTTPTAAQVSNRNTERNRRMRL